MKDDTPPARQIMNGLNPLAGISLTAQDEADEAFLRRLLLEEPPGAFEILQNMIETDDIETGTESETNALALLAVVMRCLRMTSLVIEACAARLLQDNALTMEEARSQAITLMEQWGPAPLAVAFGTPKARRDVYAAINWLSVVTTPFGLTIADRHGAAAMEGLIKSSGIRYSIPIDVMLEELAAAGIEVERPKPE